MADDPQKPELESKLKKTDDDLKDLQLSVKTGMVNVKVLMEFRQAIEHARAASAAVQQWMEKEKSGGDPFHILPKVVTERLQIATALIRDVCQDIDSGDIDFDTTGLPALHKSATSLYERLTKFFPK